MIVEYLLQFTHVLFQEYFISYVPSIRWHGNLADDVVNGSVVSGAPAVLLTRASLTETDEQHNIQCAISDCVISQH